MLQDLARHETPGDELPAVFQDWFESRGWQPRPHQLALIEHAARGQSVLLVAPTGGGKTLAGFLPSLIELARAPQRRKSVLHTLYISPLKALAVDVARNLEIPVEEMGLAVRVETRTGDTPPSRRQRQRYNPPDILLTTPEQLALMLANRGARRMFESVRAVVLDELHALANSKRGDLLALGLARLERLAPGHRRVGLSATVADPVPLQRYLVPQPTGGMALSALVMGKPGAQPEIAISASEAYVPWAGHLARHAMPDVMNAIRASKTALVFVNTRSQAERTFQELWKVNDENLPIALHHGSLAPEQRRKVEAAMTRGDLRAVVCTSTLDLGIDWGAVDRVICIGAPKGAARLVQRIGRANHRLDEPSRALLVPSNRFEVLECEAARDAVLAGELDGETRHRGGLDVLAQHVLGMACAAPFDADALFAEVTSAASISRISRARISTRSSISWRRAAMRSRVTTVMRVCAARRKGCGGSRIRVSRSNTGSMSASSSKTPCSISACRRSGKPTGAGGRVLGHIEEYFLEQLTPGDTFVFAGTVLRFEGIRETAAYVTRSNATGSAGAVLSGRQVSALDLSRRVACARCWRIPRNGGSLPHPVGEWLRIQQWRSVLPEPGQLLVETFPRGCREYLVCYPFEGRLAHQTLGMLLTRRLERMRMRPLGILRQRICAGDLGPARHGRGRHGPAVRRGHAGRRSQCVARRSPRSTNAPSAIVRSLRA